MSLANKDAAVQCREKADKLFSKGAYKQALKFYDKSLRLFPLDGVKARRDSAFICAQTKPAASAPAPAPTPAPAPSQPRRRRTAAAASAAAAPAPSSGSGAASGASSRPFTAAQKELADRILRCKDHYSVLGVERNADAAVIRKAYRKLAVKVHPDKNSAPSAAGAFQKVGAAYGVLSDADQRAHYDRFGDEPTPQVSSHAAHRHYRGDQPTAEDLFNMMFGGGVRVHHFGGGRRRQTHESREERPQGGMGQLLQIVPLLILFALTMFSFGDTKEALFSLEKSKDFGVWRETSHQAVIPHLPYYVKPDFGKRTGRDLYKVESAVEQYTYSKLRRDCSYGRQKRQQYAELAKRSSGQRAQSYMEKAKSVSLKACDSLNAFRGRYFY